MKAICHFFQIHLCTKLYKLYNLYKMYNLLRIVQNYSWRESSVVLFPHVGKSHDPGSPIKDVGDDGKRQQKCQRITERSPSLPATAFLKIRPLSFIMMNGPVKGRHTGLPLPEERHWIPD